MSGEWGQLLQLLTGWENGVGEWGQLLTGCCLKEPI